MEKNMNSKTGLTEKEKELIIKNEKKKDKSVIGMTVVTKENFEEFAKLFKKQ